MAKIRYKGMREIKWNREKEALISVLNEAHDEIPYLFCLVFYAHANLVPSPLR